MATTSQTYANFHALLATPTASGGPFNYLADTIVLIPLSSSYTPNLDTHAFISDLTGEVTTNGAGRKTLANKTFVKVGTGAAAKYAMRSDAVVQTAAGGPITARYYAIAKSTGTPTTSPLIGLITMDDTPLDINVPDGSTWTETPDATNGWGLI